MRTRRRNYDEPAANTITSTNNTSTSSPNNSEPTTGRSNPLPPAYSPAPSLSADALPFIVRPPQPTPLSSETPSWFPPVPTSPIFRPAGEPPIWEIYEPPTRNNDILFTTRHFAPPPPPGTYWRNNVLHSEQMEFHNEWDSNDNTHPEELPPPTNVITKHKSKRAFDKRGVHTIINQNIHGIHNGDDSKIKSLIQQMKQHNWAAVCIQETWQLGSTTYYIDGYKVIMHGHTTNRASTENGRTGRNKAGVCIILNPFFAEAHKRAKKTRSHCQQTTNSKVIS
jgi:hypothetical protein